MGACRSRGVGCWGAWRHTPSIKGSWWHDDGGPGDPQAALAGAAVPLRVCLSASTSTCVVWPRHWQFFGCMCAFTRVYVHSVNALDVPLGFIHSTCALFSLVPAHGLLARPPPTPRIYITLQVVMLGMMRHRDVGASHASSERPPGCPSAHPSGCCRLQRRLRLHVTCGPWHPVGPRGSRHAWFSGCILRVLSGLLAHVT